MRLTLFMLMKWNFYFTLKAEICIDQQIHSCLVTKKKNLQPLQNSIFRYAVLVSSYSLERRLYSSTLCC